MPVLVTVVLAAAFGSLASSTAAAQAEVTEYHGVKDYTSLIGNDVQRDAWTSGDIAFYAPPGGYTTENVTQWMGWYNRVDDLYEQMSVDPNFELIYRQNDPHFGRKKVLGVVSTCGVGCGTKSKAEADETFVEDFNADPDDFVPHWIFFYEMARTGGALEPFYGRATWPANTIIFPHLMAGVAFHDLGGDAALSLGIPGHLMSRLVAWEEQDLDWTENFAAADQQAAGGFNSHDLMAAMLYRILMETDRQTIRNILQNMAHMPPSADAVSAMCDFQRSVNAATDDQFADRLVDEWHMPADCPVVTPAPAPPTNFSPAVNEYLGLATAYDSFVMPVASELAGAGGGEGWATAWEVSTDSGVSTHLAGSLSANSVDLPVAGNQLCVRPDTDTFRAARRLETPVTSGDVWFSFNLRANNIGDGHLFVDLTAFGGGAVGKAWGRLFSIDNDRSETTIQPDQTYLVVVKHELDPVGPDGVHLWLDPDLTTEPTIATATHSQTAEVGAVDRVSLNVQHHGGGEYCFDEMRFGPPVIGPAVSPTPNDGVVHSVSCLAGNGRVDTTIVNVGDERATYRLEFEGLSPRQVDVNAGDWARMPITGRPDRSFSVTVERNGIVVSQQTVVVECDSDTPSITDDVVVITSACRAGLGYVLFQFLNESADAAGYVIEFESVANRSTTAAAYGQATRAVTGRSTGTYGVLIRRNGRLLMTADVEVDC